MSSEVVLKVENISKRYEIYEAPHHRLLQTLLRGRKQFYKEFWALKDVSFEVKKGECLGIIGRNGCGKSTLLQIIAGTLAPTSGSVSVTGKVAALLELGSGFNPEFTGRENVYMNGAIMGLSKAEMDKKFDEIAAFADIGEFIDQPVKIYSSGMMVRLAFSVVVHIDANILIVDEALAVGDMFFQAKCMLKMQKIIQNGITLLFVSHDVTAVKTLCSRAILLDRGCVIQKGDAEEVVNLYHSNMQQESLQKSQRFLNELANEKNASKTAPLQEDFAGTSFLATHYADDLRGKHFSCDQRYGDGRVKIESVKMLNANGESISEVGFLDRVTIKICICFKDIETGEYNVGFLIRNKNGLEIFGARTAELNHEIPFKKRGEKGIVCFSFENILAEGAYSINVGVSDRRKLAIPDYYDWINNACIFKSTAPQNKVFGCVINEMRQVKIV